MSVTFPYNAGEAKSNLEDIDGDAGLRADGVLVAPAVSKRWLTERLLFFIRHVGEPGNVILHQGGEARAAHGRGHDSVQQVAVKVWQIAASVQAAAQQTDELAGGLENGLSLRDCDAVGIVPWELPQGANEALIRALGAFLRKWRLFFICVSIR